MSDKPQKNEMKNMDVNPTGSQDWATIAALAKNANAAPQDQDAKDAARYRWLRDRAPFNWLIDDHLGCEGAACGAAIDAAMEKKP